MHRSFARATAAFGCSLLVLLAASSTALADPPDSSGIVLRFEGLGGFSYTDEESGLLAVSGGAETLCGDSLVEIEITEVETPSGALKARLVERESPVVVYPLVDFETLCTTPPDPIAEGTWTTVYNDNDVLVSGTRVNSFGGTSRGTVYDADGQAYRLLAHDRLLATEDGSRSVVSRVQLTPTGG